MTVFRNLVKRWQGEQLPAMTCLIVVLAVAYLPLFFGDILFFRDMALWNYPARWFVRDALLRGDSPFWNPHEGIGLSVASDPLYGIFYPPNWLFLLVPREMVANMLSWQSFAHLVLGGAGTMLLARRTGASPFGSRVAGLAWALSGFVTALWSTGLLLLAGAWFPWTALGFLSLAEAERSWRESLLDVAKAALPVAMLLLLGEIFFAVVGVGFALATTVAYLGFAVESREEPRSFARRQPSREADRGERRMGGRGETSGRETLPGFPYPPRRRLLVSAARIAPAILLGVGLGSPSWLPAMAAIHETSREAVRFGGIAASLNPYRMVEMVAPNCMGIVSSDYPASPWVGEEALLGFPLIFSVYLGASVVALALVAIKREKRFATALTGLVVGALLLAMGRFTPVYRLFVTVVPFLANMRSPEKYFLLVVGWVSLLAGLGATRLFESRSQPWRRAAILAGLLLAWAALCPALLPSRHWAEHMRRSSLMGGAAVAAILAVHWLVHRGSLGLARWLALATIAADLAAAGLPLHEFVPRRLANEVPLTATMILADDRSAALPPRLHVTPAAETVASRSVIDDNMATIQEQASRTLSANLSIVYGVAAMPGYDAATPRTLHRVSSLARQSGVAVLRLTGTKYVILPIEPTAPTPPGLDRMMEIMPRVWLLRVRDPLPRMFVAGKAEVVADDAMAGRLLSDEVLAGNVVLLAPDKEAVAIEGPADPNRASDGKCHIDTFKNAEVRATCRTDGRAMVVFVEQYFPGWTATVDGRPSPLLRANVLMRAVPIAQGEHEIVLRYRPVAMAVAAWAALASLLALAAFAVVGHRANRRVG